MQIPDLRENPKGHVQVTPSKTVQNILPKDKNTQFPFQSACPWLQLRQLPSEATVLQFGFESIHQSEIQMVQVYPKMLQGPHRGYVGRHADCV